MKNCSVVLDEKVIFENIETADSFGSRFLGLMGRKSLPHGHGMLLWNCSSVHCFFMSFPFDVIYLQQVERQLKVVALETLEPWKVGMLVPNAQHILEVGEGMGQAQLKIGDILTITPKMENNKEGDIYDNR